LASQLLRKAWSASCKNVNRAVAEEWVSTFPVELWALAGSEGRASVLAEVAVLTGRLDVRGEDWSSGAAGETACWKLPFAAWDQASMPSDAVPRSAARKGMAGVAVRTGGGGWANVLEGAAAGWLMVEWALRNSVKLEVAK